MSADESGPPRQQVTVEEDGAGTRLDIFLALKLSDISRTRIAKLVQEGNVWVNGVLVVVPKQKLAEGDSIEVQAGHVVDAEPQPENIPLDVYYEDDEVIVINKPAGLVVHPAPGHDSGTLVNALLFHCRDSLSGIGGIRRPGIVHRLDRQTSGLMVVAKNDKAHKHLSAQFADHGRSGALQRQYIALVWGEINRPQTINQPIGRSPHNRQKQAINKAGRQAVTHITPLDRFRLADNNIISSEIGCRLETGRTHQIRVHLAHLGHPVIGDQEYGKGYQTAVSRLPDQSASVVGAFKRQALHAAELGFAHPHTGESVLFNCDPPADYQRVRASFVDIA
jgi:23S rRNA pseudouridine1911/1915/1917 synthase